MKRILVLSIACTLALSSTACLKTRAQLRGTSDEGTDSQRTQTASIQDAQPQGQYVIDEIKSEITRLTGRLEDLERAQKQTTEQHKDSTTPDTLKSMEARIQELEQAQLAMIEAIKKQEAQATPVAVGDLLEKGRKEFQGGKLDGAIETLGQFLTKSPKGPGAEEATFLRAEALFLQKQYKKAIVEYSKIPEKFSKSKQMPAALYKIGLSFDSIGMNEDAKGFYQELVEKFPKSSEAKKAKAKAK